VESERQKQLAAAAEEERQKQLAAAEEEERQKQLETAAEDEQQSLPEAAGNTSLATGKSYKIQIMALKKPVDFKNFGNMPGIVVSYKGDSWYRYTLGNLPSRNEAEDMLSSIVSRGYRDAFIKANNLYPQFTIQVMAVPGPVIDLDVFSNLSDVYVTKGPDSFCRYTTGEFTSKEEAQTQLSKIKSIGYSEAFVTRIK
jgi:hypothetical protein